MTHKNYTTTAKLLHWSMALGFLVAILMAYRMTGIPGISPLKIQLFNYHKWLGVVLWVLVFIRLSWRFFYPPPPHSGTAQQIKLITAGHVFLYLLMISAPCLGYFYSLASGFPVVLFAVLPLPQLIGPDPELKGILQTAHRYAGYTLAITAIGHAGMALFHHYIKEDDSLRKMLFSMKKNKLLKPEGHH